MSNRLPWMMGVLSVGALLTAVGVGLNGFRNNPTQRPEGAPSVLSPGPNAESDPMAPRLFDKSTPIRVHVAGAVKKPGVYALPEWARVVDAMKKAGGATAQADLDAINLADQVKDGEQLRIPTRERGERAVSHPPTPEPGPVDDTAGGARSGRYPFTVNQAVPGNGTSTGAINLNTASRGELEKLPGVGPATAGAIVAYRRESGRFEQTEELLNIRGIGRKRFDRLRALVTAR